MTRERVAALKQSYHVDSVAYAPDGATVVSGSWREVNIWDVSTEKNTDTFEHRRRVGAIAFSPDGEILASANTDRFGGTDGTVLLWNVPAREYVATLGGHTERITTTAFAPDGMSIVTASRDAAVKFWDVRTGQYVSTLHKTGVWTMAFSPDGGTLASGLSEGTAKLLDVKSGRRVAMLRGHGGSVDSLAFSPDGTKLAVGARGKDQSSRGVVKLWAFPPKTWDVVRQRALITMEVPTDRGISVAFSSDSKILAVGSDDGVKLFDADTGENVAMLNEPYDNIVVFSPVGTILAAGAAGGIRLRDVLMKKDIATLKRAYPASEGSIAFSPDAKMLAVGTWEGRIELWDAETARKIASRHGHGDAVFSVAFSPDGKTIASGSRDGTALLWSTVDLTTRH